MLNIDILLSVMKVFDDMLIVCFFDMMKLSLCMIFIVVSVVISVLMCRYVIIVLFMKLIVVLVVIVVMIVMNVLLVVFSIIVYSMFENVMVELIDRLKLCDVR